MVAFGPATYAEARAQKMAFEEARRDAEARAREHAAKMANVIDVDFEEVKPGEEGLQRRLVDRSGS
jgi:hypothetical protein